MRPHLPALLVLGLALSGCGRDGDTASPAQNDPRNADPAAEGTTMDMGSMPDTPPVDPTGNPVNQPSLPMSTPDDDAEPLQDAPAEPVEAVPPRR